MYGRLKSAALVCCLILMTGCGGERLEKPPGKSPDRTEALSGEASASGAEEPAGDTSLFEADISIQGQPISLTEEYWEANIGPGYYRVGTDIPLGIMDIRAAAGSGHITSSDGTLDINMRASENGTESLTEGEILADALMGAYEHNNKADLFDLDSVETLTDEEMQELLAAAASGEETDYYPQVGFMEGVVLNVSGTITLHLKSDNSDVSGMKKRTVIGEPYVFGEGEYTAGKDLDPGTYVITVTEGVGSISSDDGKMFAWLGFPAEPGINSARFTNYSCEDGAVIRVVGVTVEMQKVSE